MAAALLYKPGERPPSKDKVAYGVLVAEQDRRRRWRPTDMHARTEVVSRHASTALWNSSEHDKIFGIAVLKGIGSPLRFFRGRTLAKIVAVLLAIATTICVLANSLAILTTIASFEGSGSYPGRPDRKTALCPDPRHGHRGPEGPRRAR